MAAGAPRRDALVASRPLRSVTGSGPEACCRWRHTARRSRRRRARRRSYEQAGSGFKSVTLQVRYASSPLRFKSVTLQVRYASSRLRFKSVTLQVRYASSPLHSCTMQRHAPAPETGVPVWRQRQQGSSPPGGAPTRLGQQGSSR
jgi:hypothetical protein